MDNLLLLLRKGCLIICLSLSLNLSANDSFFDKTRTISLLDKNNVKYEIGKIEFFDKNNTEHLFKIRIKYEKFKDFFLSMKEMKCLEGPELWCLIPYPHANPKTLSREHLAWLEHELLFMFKDKQSFGANFWNGIYYRLEWHEGVLTGDAYYVDLNKLASPPDDLATPPLGYYDLDRVDQNMRWLPQMIVE